MDCIFCNIATRLHQNVVWQNSDFWLLYDGFPIAEPHILIIPKNHVLCYGQLPHDEYESVESIIAMVEKAIGKPTLFFEHGDIGQTVKHAHLHAIPFDRDIDFAINLLGIPGKTETITELSELPKYQTYLLFMKNGDWTVFLPDADAAIAPAPITNALATYFGKPTPAANRKPPTKESVQQAKDMITGSHGN